MLRSNKRFAALKKALKPMHILQEEYRVEEASLLHYIRKLEQNNAAERPKQSSVFPAKESHLEPRDD